MACIGNCRGGRKLLPKDLPRVIVTHELSKAEQCCGSELQKIDEVISEQLDIIPAQITVIEHVRYKCSCKRCNEALKTAPMPPQPILKSRASAEFLAYIATTTTKYYAIEKSLPVLTELKKWFDHQYVNPAGKLWDTIHYTLKQRRFDVFQGLGLRQLCVDMTKIMIRL